MENLRFKIDFSDNAYHPYAIYVREPSYINRKWKKLDDFRERKAAVALYESIKDLPEYLP